MRRASHIFLLCLVCLGLGPLVGSAGAAPSVESSSLSLTSTQAGAHADITLAVALEDPGEPETARNLLIDLPPGFFLYPSFQVRCSAAQFGESKCPVDSQIGIVTIRGKALGDPDSELGTAAVRLLAPETGEIARLGFVVPTVEAPVEGSITASPGNDHGLELTLENLPSTVPLRSLALTLWGIPADAVHDADRFPGGTPSGQPSIPFLRNPTSCGPAGSLSVAVDSYEDPGDFATATTPTPVISSCGALEFPAVLDAGLTATEAGTPLGLNLTVEIPGNLAPDGLSSSDTREILLTLPPQLELDEDELEAAPSLGSFTAAVLGAEAPVGGSISLDEAESPGAYRLLLAGIGGGIHLSVQAFLEYDEAAEAWALEIPNMPQLPFEELKLQLASGGGPFIVAECGSLTGSSALTPWSGQPPLLGTIEMAIDSGPEGGPCPEPEEPVVVPPATPPSILPRPPAALPLPPPKPVVQFRRRPPTQTRDRTPSFRFSSSIAGSTFQCKIDRRPLRPCRSPLTLPRLAPGRHTFKVQATAPTGTRSFFSSYSFVIRR